MRLVAPVLRILQLNAGSLLEPGWAERRHEVLAWFERLDPDVVCLQEIWEDADHANTAGWLVEHAPPGRWHWVFGGLRIPPELWPDGSLRFGCAVLSRWPIDHHQLVPLPVDEDPHEDSPFFRLRLPLLHARTAGLDVFATHLVGAPQQAYHRVRQVQFVDEQVKALADPGAAMPPVLCGDFNAEPDSDEIRFLCSLATIGGVSTYYQEAWRAAGRTEPGFTWDGRVNPIAALANLPPKRIDYVFVGNPFRRPDRAGLVRSADLACHEPLTGVLASDHFGVVVEVAWPQRPGG